VVASAVDAKLAGLDAGVYLVGTGCTGVVDTLTTCGAGYFALMTACALTFRAPMAMPSEQDSNKAPDANTAFNVPVEEAYRTPQFWLLFTGFGLSITGSFGMISCGANMLNESMAGTYPDLITRETTAAFIMSMSGANLFGRLFWSNMSDYFVKSTPGHPLIGRRNMFFYLWGVGPPFYMSVLWASNHLDPQSIIPLAMFTGGMLGVQSCDGGTKGTRPAIVADMFGTKNLTTLAALQLCVVWPASTIGPQITMKLRDMSLNDNIQSLSKLVDDSSFSAAFGSGKEHLPELIQNKVVTINRLMELTPPGTIDPTPFMYNNALLALAGLQLGAVFTNSLVQPIKPPVIPPTVEEIQEIQGSGVGVAAK